MSDFNKLLIRGKVAYHCRKTAGDGEGRRWGTAKSKAVRFGIGDGEGCRYQKKPGITFRGYQRKVVLQPLSEFRDRYLAPIR